MVATKKRRLTPDPASATPPRKKKRRVELDVTAERIGRATEHRAPIAGDLLLPPGFVEFRPHQTTAIHEILNAYDEGYQVVMLDAPTGAGKTIIAEAVRQELEGTSGEGGGGRGARGVYACSTKSLQHQFVGDFAHAKVLMGRKNYPTQSARFPEITADDCDLSGGGEGEGKALCTWCPEPVRCRYRVSRQEAMDGDLAVLNTAYLLADTNHGRGNFRGRELVVLDECDVLESELMRFVEFAAGDRLLRELGLEAPKKGSHKTTIQTWVSGELVVALEVAMKKARMVSGVEGMRRAKRYGALLGQAKVLDVTAEWWIRDNDAGGLTMKPYRVDVPGESALWEAVGGQKWLMMSGTIISPDQFADDLGLSRAGIPWTMIHVPYTFPQDNRPVIYAPVADMSKKGMEKGGAVGKMARALRRVVERHPGENVLVHAVSYKLAGELTDLLRRELSDADVVDGRVAGVPVLTYSAARERDHALEVFKRDGGVLIAPSMDRGVDLPGDLCTVQVIVKVPFPNLGDPLISARLHDNGQMWYAVQTARTLMQMTGRAIRSKDDVAVTYVFDQQFARYWAGNKRILNDWWVETVRFEGLRAWI